MPLSQNSWLGWEMILYPLTNSYFWPSLAYTWKMLNLLQGSRAQGFGAVLQSPDSNPHKGRLATGFIAGRMKNLSCRAQGVCGEECWVPRFSESLVIVIEVWGWRGWLSFPPKAGLLPEPYSLCPELLGFPVRHPHLLMTSKIAPLMKSRPLYLHLFIHFFISHIGILYGWWALVLKSQRCQREPEANMPEELSLLQRNGVV